jgi:hypothetical protein
MKKVIVGLSLVIVLALSTALVYAQQGVAGNWVLSVSVMSMPMTLTQEGEKVSGTIDSPHGVIPLKGEFSKGKLSLVGAATDAHPVDVAATGTLNADGSLSGNLSVNAMEMSFTAVRK